MVLIGIPAAAFIVPDLWGGHLLMTGDNLQQNYPLHVLVGSMLRHGQLPLWNQYIFSGSPLLAGFNAGALYPLVGLFVVLPDRVAWVLTEVILFSLIAVGMYVFLRALALSTVACVLAAATFAFSGVVLSQVSHVDMTEGYAALPWMLLAVRHIVRDGRWRWAVVLGICFASVILGGAPEAMLDEAILVLAYAVVSAGPHRARLWRVASRGGTAAVLALSLAALQWLPGLTAIADSQRSGLGASFAASGSYPPGYGFLSLVPYLYGGYGKLGEATFFSHYNLPEVGIYVGILPIVALLTMWHPRWPSRLAHRERLTWYVVGLLGLLLALGDNTPLEHVFNALPLYGHQRLQSRNMMDVSVALCVLFAGWMDRRSDPAGSIVRFDRRVALVPLAVVAGLGLWALLDPSGLVTGLTTASASARTAHTVRVATLTAVGFCVAAAVVVWLRSVIPPRWWFMVVTMVMAIDLGLVAGTSALVSTPSNAVLSGSTPIEQFVAAHLAPGGRFYVYDPQHYSGRRSAGTGLPDDNILAILPSVGGYASIVNGNYNSLTLTHTPGELNVPQLGEGRLKELDLLDVLSLPEYFLVPLAQVPNALGGTVQLSESAGQDPVLPSGNSANFVDTSYPYYPAPRGPGGPGHVTSWFFGTSLTPGAAHALFTSPVVSATLRFGLIGRTGRTKWGQPVSAAGVNRIDAALPLGHAVGLTVEVLSGHLPNMQMVVTVNHRPYELDGSLSAAIRPGPWRVQGFMDGYALLVRKSEPSPVYTMAAASRGEPHISIVSKNANVERIHLRVPSSVVVVRDVAWDPGWRASVSVGDGHARDLALHPHGLVQQVRVPAGDDVVTFRYRPPHVVVAAILSAGALLFLVVLLGRALLDRRRRGRISSTGEPG
jgi:hypothetical protein